MYSVRPGDTFERIARREYGDSSQARRIARANPGVSEPLTAGTTITVPTLPGAPQDLPGQLPAANEDEVAILIDGQRFRFWDTVRVTRSVDSMDTVDFGAPFDPDAAGFRETFRPFTFKPVAITVGGNPLFTGTMVNIAPMLANDQITVAVSGYSTPGVLADCTSPASDYPLEFSFQSLKDISDSIIAPFGLASEFREDPGPVFERVANNPGGKSLAFLTDLAQQRGLVISSTERGGLLYWRAASKGRPVARLQQGQAPVLSVTPFFQPQQYYSHVTGVEPVLVGLSGDQYTVRNPRLAGTLRPLTYEAPDSLEADLVQSVEAKAGRMFANVAAYSMRVSTWRDPDGRLWQPNTTLKLLAPGAMIYSEYEFLIRRVEFEEQRKTKTATLELVIPEAFRGELPEVLPWDD